MAVETAIPEERRSDGWGALALALTLGLVACDRAAPPAPVSPASRPAPSFHALGNLEYPSKTFDGVVIRLSDGHYEAPADQPDAERLIASADLHPLSAVGELDGDGSPDAAVVLSASGGGSGTFYELIAVLNSATGLAPLPGVPLGDRIGLKRLDVRNGVIEVEMVVAGPDDPLCCPTLRAVRAFKVVERTLVETSVPNGSL